MFAFHKTLILIIDILFIIRTIKCQETVFNSVLRHYRNALNEAAATTTTTNVFNKEYDYVVIGAGSGGSVVANRLTEIPDWSVLLLEAGKDEMFLTDIPLLVSYIIPTDYNWGYKTEPSSEFCLAMNEQRCNWHRGKGMGGTSIINYMVYSRGSRADYNNWELLGNKGWSYNDVLPYFLKSEDIAVKQLKSSPFHATGGYLTVDRPHWSTPLGRTFIDALNQAGYGYNDNNHPNPVGVFPVLATTRNGARLSASKAYLRPINSRRNLHIGKQARVTKVLIDSISNQTFGVEFVKNKKRYIIRARKEVILSAGSLNSPQLLMLSGIGPKEHLTELGIETIQDLKVGYNLQDHISMAGLVFLINDTVSVVESRYQRPQYFLDYIIHGNGPLTMPGGAESVAFITSKFNQRYDQPDLELVMGPGSLVGDTGGSLRKMFSLREDIFNEVYGPYVGQDAFSVVPVLLQPRSKGRIKLRSKNPFHWPVFYANYYNDEHDIRIMVEGIKQAVEIGESRAFSRYNSRLLRRPLPACRHFSFGSDEYWACVARQFTTNLHHQVGTCKMGPPSDPDAVVDPQLRVRGVKGLRVVDASIMPVIPTGHTNAIIFMIGEKAADMIKDDWVNYDKSKRSS